MSRMLLAAGGLVFVALGILHGHLTLRDLWQPRALTPSDPRLREAMQAESLRLHQDIKLWDAWMGFNLSHSLGLMVFGAAVLWCAADCDSTYTKTHFLPSMFILIGCAYVAMACRFWFWIPAVATSLGTVCIIAAYASLRAT